MSGLAVDTEILTTAGFVRLADLEVGSELVHPGGHAISVVGISPPLPADCYEVATIDRRGVVGSADQTWRVTDRRRERSVGPLTARRRWFEQRTVSAQEMHETGTSRYNDEGKRHRSVTDGKTYATQEYRYQLPEQEPIKCLPDRVLPVDPYLFGAWLGDGTSANASFTCSHEDKPYWIDVITQAGFIATDHKTKAAPHLGITTTPGPGRRQRSLGGHLSRLGVQNNKHVPEQYLTAGAHQREALLQGLIDTDGHVDARRGQVEFCAMNVRLAEAVLFLSRSLGWRATLRTGRATLNGVDCGTKYRVCFTPKQCDPFTPARMPRKAERIHPTDGGKGRHSLSVASVAPTARRPVRSISVDSPDGLFLAGRGLVPVQAN